MYDILFVFSLNAANALLSSMCVVGLTVPDAVSYAHSAR
jgi:hypothetical protein